MKGLKGVFLRGGGEGLRLEYWSNKIAENIQKIRKNDKISEKQDAMIIVA